MSKEFNRHFSREDGQMVNKHTKRCLTFVIGEMKIKTTMRQYFTPAGMPLLKKRKNRKHVGKDAEKLEAMVGMQNGSASVKNSVAVPQKNEKQNCQMNRQVHFVGDTPKIQKRELERYL